jgi:hypothetical protein
MKHTAITATSPALSSIALLNDRFRSTFFGGNIVITPIVQNLDGITYRQLLHQVRTFDAFTEENDPYREHDFGRVCIRKDSFYWKIDYYDTTLKYGSEDPANPDITTRVLTIMHSSEY